MMGRIVDVCVVLPLARVVDSVWCLLNPFVSAAAPFVLQIKYCGRPDITSKHYTLCGDLHRNWKKQRHGLFTT